MKWKLPIIAVTLFFANTASAGTLEEILKGKQMFGQGVCGFKDGKFQAFGGEVLVAPKSAIDRFENCLMLVQDPTLNPAWLVILNDKGKPTEVIKWTDPGQFQSVWRGEVI